MNWIVLFHRAHVQIEHVCFQEGSFFFFCFIGKLKGKPSETKPSLTRVHNSVMFNLNNLHIACWHSYHFKLVKSHCVSFFSFSSPTATTQHNTKQKIKKIVKTFQCQNGIQIESTVIKKEFKIFHQHHHFSFIFYVLHLWKGCSP